jgi:hypothetical protein
MIKITQKYCFFVVFLALFFSSCTRHENISTLRPAASEDSTGNVYKYYWGEKDGFKIWIVDGAKIRKDIFGEFVFGGNGERYPFVPEKEIWIDNSVSAEEFETTLAHELNERNLMAKTGMSYFDAHDSSLALEVKMRREWEKLCREHEDKLPKVSPTDFDSTQEIEDLPDMIRLKNIYRIPLGERNGVKLWVVDGYAVRRDIYPDFGVSGNGEAYHFIPEDEIWIDGSFTCEETEYSISLEMKERELIMQGKTYDDAYTEALKVTEKMRDDTKKLIDRQPPVKKTDPLYRDNGTGKEK